MKSTTRGQKSFAQANTPPAQRSQINRSHGLKTTFSGGDLVPIFLDQDILPGDTMTMDVSMLLRLATPLHPVMENIYATTFFFAIPNRRIWQNWRPFMGENPNPSVPPTEFTIPQIISPVTTGYDELSIYDYMGIPPKVAELTHSALPLRAYNFVFNEWFRDENLIDALPVNALSDGPDDVADYEIKKRGKRFDYATSALPFPQKGPDVVIGIGTSAPLVTTGDGIPDFKDSIGTTTQLAAPTGAVPSGTGVYTSPSLGIASFLEWDDPKLEADLTAATSITINALRESITLQHMLETDARGGTRYTEVIKAHFHVDSPDSRQMRPEYLGGKTTRININPVPQTSATDDAVSAQGNLAAYGTASESSRLFTYTSTEHQIILGLVCCYADLNYQQGLDRSWSRLTRYDYFWPALAFLGEQEVLQKELFALGTDDDDIVFGYQERYAEYRYKPSQITGRFRSSATQSLDTWHLAQNFSTPPVLNEDFISEDPPFFRINAVTTEPDFIGDFYFSYNCVRPVPLYSTPGLKRL